jgi:alcohol dehydrogenase
MKKFLLSTYYRLYQASFKLAMPLLPWRKPVVMEGPGSVKKVPDLLQRLKIKNVLIVTDSTLMKLGLLDNLITELGVNGCQYAVFDKTVPDPTIENVEEALKVVSSVQLQGHYCFWRRFTDGLCQGSRSEGQPSK